jgi:hypothetical protein
MNLNNANRLACAATCIILGLALEAWADDLNFIPIDVPAAMSTFATGQIVGSYDANGLPHGFLDRHENLTTIDFPTASRTFLSGINNRSDIVDDYSIPPQDFTVIRW